MTPPDKTQPQPAFLSAPVPVRTGTLTVVTGGGATAATETTVTPDKNWIIGRSHGADIVIDDSCVSRRHLVVERDADVWVIRDVSSNGSWHDGARIDSDGLLVPPTGQLRINLCNPAGPEVVITGDSAPDQYGRPAEPTGFGPVLAAEQGNNGAQPAAGRPKKRRGRRLGILLLVLVLLLVIADRVAASVAATAAVSQIVQQSQGLASEPTVSFGGFPFLTQVAFGKYTDIGVGIDGITTAGAPRIEHISAHLNGAHIPLSEAIHDNVANIPVDHVTGTVVLRFSDLNAFLKDQPGHLVLAASDGTLQVSGSVEEGGRTVNVKGSGRLEANGSGLMITPTNLHVDGAGDVGDALNGLNDVVGGALSLFPAVPVPLPDLPFHFRLTSVHVHQDGVEASAAADKLVLEAPQ